MAPRRKLPDDATMRRLFEDGLTNDDIASQYAVSAEAVRQRRVALGMNKPQGHFSHSRHLPWQVKYEHSYDTIAKRLRALSKHSQGASMSPAEERLLDEWLRFMDGDNPLRTPLSVHYDREDEDGFWLEARRPGDRDYISPPRASVRSV